MFTTESKLIRLTREMQVSYTELGTIDMDRKEYFATTTQILDITVATMLWAARNRPCPFLTNLFFQFFRSTTSMDIFLYKCDLILKYNCFVVCTIKKIWQFNF